MNSSIVTFIITVVVPFIFLPWKWAIFLLLFVAVLSPMFSFLFFAPFKKALKRLSHNSQGISMGVAEGLVAISLVFILSEFTNSLDTLTFLLVLVAIHSKNQIGRTMQSAGDNKFYDLEKGQLLGYVVTTSVLGGLVINPWLIFILFVGLPIYKTLTKGKVDFWAIIANHPDNAYEFFKQSPDVWMVVDSEEIEKVVKMLKKTKPDFNNTWAGAYKLYVPSIAETISVYGKVGLYEKEQQKFIEMFKG